MAKMTVDEYFCKGCGLCVDACPLDIVRLDGARITSKGYHPRVLHRPERLYGLPVVRAYEIGRAHV